MGFGTKCGYCGALNASLDRRCQRCGRRLAQQPVTTGALAAVPALAPDTQELPAPQAPLFADRPSSNIIPFESIAGGARVAPPHREPAPPVQPVARPQARRTPPGGGKPPKQPTLDFLPPAQPGPKTLKTKVEASIYCDAPVATVAHRAVAAALDLSLILIGYALFLGAFHFCGGDFVLTRVSIAVFGAVFALLAGFYGLLWALASGESPGMRWTQLRVINFDGFLPERRERFIRFAGACLSYAAAGLGILWALVDEEGLTWHDHISKTFPTPREVETNFVRKR